MVPGTGQDMTWWNRMLKTRSPEIADAIVSTVTALAPDFVVHCGDVTDDGALASFHQAKKVMDRMGCPYYLTLGNHDTFQPGTRGAITGLFENGDGTFYYARDLGGLRFVFLDCAYWIRRDGQEDEHIDRDIYKAGGYLGIGPSKEELDWLKKELAANEGTPTIVVAHTPILSKPTFPVGSLPNGQPVKHAPSPYTDIAEYCVGHKKLMQTITSARNVRAVLTGHWHIFDVVSKDGIHHCQTGSMIEFPFEMRLAQISDGHMSITAVPLNDRSFQEMSLLKELGNSWVAGECEDRELGIDLT